MKQSNCNKMLISILNNRGWQFKKGFLINRKRKFRHLRKLIESDSGWLLFYTETRKFGCFSLENGGMSSVAVFPTSFWRFSNVKELWWNSSWLFFLDFWKTSNLLFDVAVESRACGFYSRWKIIIFRVNLKVSVESYEVMFYRNVRNSLCRCRHPEVGNPTFRLLRFLLE